MRRLTSTVMVSSVMVGALLLSGCGNDPATVSPECASASEPMIEFMHNHVADALTTEQRNEFSRHVDRSYQNCTPSEVARLRDEVVAPWLEGYAPGSLDR